MTGPSLAAARRVAARLALAIVTLAAVPAVAPADAPLVSASPPLQPAFDPAIGDYVTRCSDTPVELAVDAPDGTSVAVDGDGPRSGTFTRSVALAASQGFSFTLSGDAAGEYHVRCLPSDFPPYGVQRTGTPQARFYAVTPVSVLGTPPAGVSQQFVALWDSGGAPIWWYRAPQTPFDAKLLPNGDIAWIRATAPRGIDERRADGTLVRDLNTAGTDVDFHDVQLLPNGNYLLPVYRPLAHVDLSAIGMPADATIADAVVQEVTPAGALVWEWRASDHIAPAQVSPDWWSRIQARSADGYDIYHLNSIEHDGGDLVLSFRHLDAVYKVAASGAGDVRWKIGGVDVPGTSLQVVGDPVVGLPAGDPLGPLAGQHDARILPDGDLTVSDNGTRYEGVQLSGRQPRAVRYAIDETSRTATFVEQLTDPDVTQSTCCGSARKLPGGNWVMGWGANQRVSEARPGGERVFSLDFAPPIYSYRANPILPAQLSPRTLRAGMDDQFPRTGLTIAGASSRFGTVVAAAGTQTRTLSVRNSGLAPVHISDVAVDAADGADFALADDGCSGVTIGADIDCAVTIRFQPAATGAKTARLRVLSDAASSPNEAVLTGDAASPSSPPPPPGEAAPLATPLDTGATATTPPPVARASNLFGFASVRPGRQGALTVTLTLPGPGSLDARLTSGTRTATITIAHRPTRAVRAGAASFVLRPTATGTRVLHRHGGRLRVTLSVRFTPPGAGGRTRSRRVTLRTRDR